VPDAPRFLLVRLDGLGDALACVPALEGLRRAHPSARFGAICSPANAAVFSARVDAVHVLTGDDRAPLAAALRERAYTHAIVATEEVAGYELARGSGAARRSGFWHRFEKPFKSLWQYAQLTDRVYRPAAWTARPEHEVEALYRLVLPFGAAPPPPDDAAALRQWLAVEGGAAGKRAALGVQITAKLALEGWGAAALAELCATALDASGLSALSLVAAPDDGGLARALLEHLPAAVRMRATIAPPSDVPHWFGSIDSLAVLVTPDTGAAHAAGMLGVPVIDLFEQTRFSQLSRQWRPWAAPHRCMIKPPAGATTPAALGAQIGAAVAALRTQDARA
jgi:ADP-heptose:LPS heptosyltransferase